MLDLFRNHWEWGSLGRETHYSFFGNMCVGKIKGKAKPYPPTVEKPNATSNHSGEASQLRFFPCHGAMLDRDG